MIMIDIQSETDNRGVELSCAGIRQVEYPVSILIDNKKQHTVAKISCSVKLTQDKRGTHMSRFLEVLSEQTDSALSHFSLENLSQWHQIMLNKLEVSSGRISLQAPIFLEKVAPASGKKSLMNYDLTLDVYGSIDNPSINLTIKVPCTSCCPCSKAISKYGAHNQRTIITVTLNNINTQSQLSISQVIKLIETSSSCEIFALIKRSDEQFVTERAYENTKFAEDIARDCAQNLLTLQKSFKKAHIDVENFESIHNHSAFASCCIDSQ